MAFSDLDTMEKGEAGESIKRSLSDLSSTPTKLESTSCSNLKNSSQKNFRAEDVSVSRRSWIPGCSWMRQWWESKHDHEPLIVRSLSSCPRGYPRLAAFLDSDENFMIYRRFGYVQGRLLLEKQDELRKLEQRLDKYDKQVEKTRSINLMTRDLPPGETESRKEIMDKLEQKFCEYARLISAAQQLVAMNRPSPSEYNSVENYIHNTQPLRKEEQSWILCKEDLITLRPGREHAWLDTGIEHLLKWTHCSLVEFLFCSAETRRKTSLPGDDHDHNKDDGSNSAIYYTRPRINRLVSCIITAMLLVLLVVPVYIMYHLVTNLGNNRTDAVCIGVLLVFTLAFSAVLSLFTRAKRHEILGAAAAYCAVLVVFLGNVGNGNSFGH